jgi:hypothetical protein
MPVIRKFVLVAAAFGIVFSGGGQFPDTYGCTLCVDIRGSLWGIHPQSISTAVAIRKEIESGAISQKRPQNSAAMTEQILGFRMRKLVNHHHGEVASLELLLIETGARFRIDPSNPKSSFIRVKPGEKLPQPSVRWVTGRDVLHAFLARQMTVSTAVERGIMFIEKPIPRKPDLAETEKKRHPL